MRTWTPPDIPALPGKGSAPRLFNTATGRVEHPPLEDETASLYVCGVTPYDATHLGHAATYLAYDILLRAWRDAGVKTVYAQNITDVDDPLLERANATGVDWRNLADQQIALFRSDMHRLGMIPPDQYVAVTEAIDPIAEAVQRLRARGLAYEMPTPDAEGDDLYFDVRGAVRHTEWRLGDIAPYDHDLMLALSSERGGDPERLGKRDPLDPLLWRAARPDEPSWDSVVGKGRPGWHIECSVIASRELGNAFTVQGGGADLVFPHHEFSAAHATSLSGTPFALLYCHTGLLSYQGHKMSKSRGNLVFVSELLAEQSEPGAIRLALLSHHYRKDWEWHDEDIARAHDQLARWRDALSVQSEHAASSLEVLSLLRQAVSDDLNTPQMIEIIDQALMQGVDEPSLLAHAVQALLGIDIVSVH